MTIYDETLNIYRSKKNRKEKTCFMIHVFFGLTAHSSNLDSLLNFKWSPFYKPQGIPYDCSSLMHYDDQVNSHNDCSSYCKKNFGNKKRQLPTSFFFFRNFRNSRSNFEVILYNQAFANGKGPTMTPRCLINNFCSPT